MNLPRHFARSLALSISLCCVFGVDNCGGLARGVIVGVRVVVVSVLVVVFMVIVVGVAVIVGEAVVVLVAAARCCCSCCCQYIRFSLLVSFFGLIRPLRARPFLGFFHLVLSVRPLVKKHRRASLLRYCEGLVTLMRGGCGLGIVDSTAGADLS